MESEQTIQIKSKSSELTKEEKKKLKLEKREKMRAEKFEHIKEKTKQRTREHIKKKRREFAEKRDRECEGMTEEEKKEWMEKQRNEVIEKKQKMRDAMLTGQRIAVDIHYQDQMNLVEQHSVIRQLGLCHKANKDAKEHVSIHVCGATPENTPFLQSFGAAKWPMTFHEESIEKVFTPEEMVYFSPDATEEIESIDPSKVYIIGGLVDRSIVKNQSFLRAQQLGVHAVKLPLLKYYPECEHRILNINTLVEIIIYYTETHDWRRTFELAIPIRKVKMEDETGKNYDYHNIHSQEELEKISEFQINRFEIKHALHIFCEKNKKQYVYENREVPYEEYEEKYKDCEKKPPFLRFHAKVFVDGQYLGEGYGKSQRSAQSKAAWYALVALGDIHLENLTVCLIDSLTNNNKGKHKQYTHFVYSSKYLK